MFASREVNFEVGVRPVAEFFKQFSSRQIFPQSINGRVLVEIIVRFEIDFSLVLKSCQDRVKNRLPCQLPQHRTHQATFDRFWFKTETFTRAVWIYLMLFCPSHIEVLIKTIPVCFTSFNIWPRNCQFWLLKWQFPSHLRLLSLLSPKQ